VVQFRYLVTDALPLFGSASVMQQSLKWKNWNWHSLAEKQGKALQ